MTDLQFLRLDKPKLSWNKKDSSLVIYFKLGEDYLQSSFKFDYYKFLDAYSCMRGSRSDDSKWFDVWKSFGAKDSIATVLGMICKFYRLNPTVCKRAIHQDKTYSKKIELEPKKGVVDKVKGISKPRGCHGAYGKRDGMSGANDIPFAVDNDKVNTILFLMQSCVEDGARNWSLQGYSEYRRLYSDLLRANGSSKSGYISKAKDRLLLKEFASKVANLQRG